MTLSTNFDSPKKVMLNIYAKLFVSFLTPIGVDKIT